MISTETTPTNPTDQERQRHRWRRLLVGLAVALPLGLTLTWAGTYAWNAWSAYAGYLKYEPREGDVVFQSLPHGPVVWAIEGVTKSPYSHCGIVGSRDGRWIVYGISGRLGHAVEDIFAAGSWWRLRGLQTARGVPRAHSRNSQVLRKVSGTAI